MHHSLVIVAFCLNGHKANLEICTYKMSPALLLTHVFRAILKPRGHLVILDYLDQTYYIVNDEKFSVLSTTEEEIKTTFKSLGFEIEHFDTHVLGDYPEPAPCDAKTLYCVVGKKL